MLLTHSAVRATVRSVHVTGGTQLKATTTTSETKDSISQVFRNAFEQGYREGFQRFAYNRRGR